MYMDWLLMGMPPLTKLLLLRLCFWPIELAVKLPIKLVKWFIDLPLK